MTRKVSGGQTPTRKSSCSGSSLGGRGHGWVGVVIVGWAWPRADGPRQQPHKPMTHILPNTDSVATETCAGNVGEWGGESCTCATCKRVRAPFSRSASAGGRGGDARPAVRDKPRSSTCTPPRPVHGPSGQHQRGNRESGDLVPQPARSPR